MTVIILCNIKKIEVEIIEWERRGWESQRGRVRGIHKGIHNVCHKEGLKPLGCLLYTVGVVLI